VKISASKDKGGWHIRLDGKPRGMAGEFFGIPFAEGEGTFTADRDEAQFYALKASVNGMPVNLQGRIKSGRGTPHPPGFDIVFSSEYFKTQALSKGLYLDDSGITFSGKVTGTAVEPKLEGTFSSNYLFASPLRLNNVHGTFVREADKFVLKNAEALGAGAKIVLTGYVDPAAGYYDLSLSGDSLDATQMTDNRVTGVVKIKARVTGRNQADSATGSGQFVMERGRYFSAEGNIRGEEIRLLEGDIVIQNGQMGTQNAVMKLGRNKYSVSVTAGGDKDAAEIKLEKKQASSLF